MDDALAQPDVTVGVAEQRLRSVAHQSGNGKAVSYFHIPSMRCGGCMSKIESGLEALPFVETARANLSTKRVSVTWDMAGGQATAIGERLSELGFEHLSQDDEPSPENGDPIGKRLLISVGVAGFAAANIMLLSVSVWSGADEETRQLFHLLSGLIAIPAVAFAGKPFFTSALGALRHKQLNMDVPISLAVLLAVGMSIVESIRGGPHAYFDASVMLLFFLLIGRYLDHVMRERARGAVNRLSQMASKGATVIDSDGIMRFVPLSEISEGMRLSVAAGERVPVDGIVMSGASDVDRSVVTGESETQLIAPDDAVEGGTLNLTAPLEIKATKTADQSFLAEVTQMMEAAEQGKSRFVRVADRFARIYAPAVHVLALMTLLGWMVVSGGDVTVSLYRAIAVLIITCPCALGLAVPIVHVLGAGRLFDEGVMVKDGAAFEKLNDVDTIVFDKTGTLTLGRPNVIRTTDMVPADRSCIAALAERSVHPSARAVSAFLRDADVVDVDVDNIREKPGAGVEAICSGHEVRLGKREWVSEIASDLPWETSRGGSGVTFAREGQPATLFELVDALRPDAEDMVRQLKKRGVDLKIFSGDSAEPVKQAADRLGIADFESDLTPRDKIDRINALQASGRKVLMIGDGINDAPALAAAHVSMAPSSGSDVGRQAADLVFTRKSLAAVPFTMTIAKRVDGLVRQNFALALVYNCLAVPLAVFGYVTPLVAAIAMSGSSIIVVANSMRLYFGSRLPAVDDGATRPARIEGRPRVPVTEHRERLA